MLDITWHGEPAFQHRSATLTAVVLPRRGGRIASLIDADGREWLEQPMLPLLDRSVLPTSFVDGDMFGWDECAPTIDECTVGPWTMPDHGDVWDVEWIDHGDGWLSGTSPAGLHELRRRITPNDDGLRLEYRATTTTAALPYLWAAHPQFAAPEGSWVELPASVVELIDGEDAHLARRPISRHLTSIDSFPPEGAGKWFVDPDVPVSQASLRRADGSSLEMRWDASVAPYLGIWFDRGRHSRHDVIAIEPMTGWFDTTAVALERDRVSTLRADAPMWWWVDLRVSL